MKHGEPTDYRVGFELMATWTELPVTIDGGLLRVGDHGVMHENERPIMRRFAEIVAGDGRDVLEMGFGLGICASEIQARGCKSHTIIEAHPVIAANAREWAKSQPHPVTIVEGYWQEWLPSLGWFDGVIYDSFVYSDGDGAEGFIQEAIKHIRLGGSLAAWNDELPAPDAIARLLKDSFSTVEWFTIDRIDCPTIPQWQRQLTFPLARGRF